MHGGSQSSLSKVDVDLTADEHGMREAPAVAERGLERGELPIGAVVVADGRVLGSSHTEEVTQRRLLVHAELLALEEADRHDGWDRRLFCHPELHRCVKQCASNADCPPAWVCAPTDAAACQSNGGSDLTGCAGAPICVNPTCGTN